MSKLRPSSDSPNLGASRRPAFDTLGESLDGRQIHIAGVVSHRFRRAPDDDRHRAVYAALAAHAAFRDARHRGRPITRS